MNGDAVQLLDFQRCPPSPRLGGCRALPGIKDVHKHETFREREEGLS